MLARGAAVGLALIALTAAANPASAQDRIRVDGSMGSIPLVRALADAYRASHPGMAIEFGTGLGTRARIEALAGGSIDIALASHGINTENLTRQGLEVAGIARTAVVFATNESVAVRGLSDQQICGIFAGQLTNWRQLGGADLAIAAHTRPESEVDTEVIREGVGCLKGLTFAPGVAVVARGSDMIKELSGTTGAFGVTTATAVEQSKGKIRALELNGVAASEANVSDGKYRIVREVFVVTKTAAGPGVERFLAFMRSPEGAAVIRANGALPTTTASR